MKLKVVILFSFLFLHSCSDDKVKPTINFELNEDRIPVQESWNSRILFTEEDKIKAVLFADHLAKYEDEQKTYLDTVKINFYDDEGIPSTTLTSKRGLVDDISKNMFAIDSVVVVNSDGVVLRTQELTWNNFTKKITSNKFVRIESPKEIIEGYGFESDQHLNKYVIYDVTYSAEIEENQ